MTKVANNYSANDFFSKKVHTKIGKEIYKELNWFKIDTDTAESLELELKSGINHMYEADNLKVGINERFRRNKYKNYNDITIRYRNEYSKHLVLNRSEFFKIKASYMVYGITDENCEIKSTKFVKYIVVNLSRLFNLIDNGKIVINESLKECKIINNVLNVIKKQNYGNDSSFIAIDVLLLKSYLKDYPDLITKQYNYF